MKKKPRKQEQEQHIKTTNKDRKDQGRTEAIVKRP